MSLRTERLRESRERRGWTQRQLAELCGLGEQQIYRYETGRADPSAMYLKVVAEKLNVTTDYLLGLSDQPHGYTTDQLPPEERELLRAYSERDVSTVLSLISDWLREIGQSTKTNTNPRE